MSFLSKFDRKAILAGLVIVVFSTWFSFSSYMPFFVFVGQVTAALYLVVGMALSLRLPNEIAMPRLQFAGRVLHGQIFYALVVSLSANVLFFCVEVLLRLLGLDNSVRWALLISFALSLSTPVVMAGFSRFLLSKTAGWDRLKSVFEPKNLMTLPLAILTFSAILAIALSLIIDQLIMLANDNVFQWLCLLIIWGGVIILFSRIDFQIRNSKLRISESNSPQTPLEPSKILFVGADAADWHVIMPLIKAGRMPQLKSLMDTGSYGYLDTYGRMHSPVIWTTIATGASVDLHGIDDFFKHDPKKKDKRSLFKSYDRKLPAIWNMINQMGLSVGVINWLLTYPPEKVNKYMISHMREDPAVYPPELEGLLADALSNVNELESDPDSLETTTDMGKFRLVRPPEEAIKDLRRIGAVAPRFMHDYPADLTLVYEDATDGIQHTAWQYREPARFDPEAWGYDVADIERYGNAIDEAWEEFDEVLGVLLEEFDQQNGIVMVVSDHGFMPREVPAVYLDMNALLHDLRYLEFNIDGSVDFGRTSVYWSTRDITSSFTDLSINLDQDSDQSRESLGDSENNFQQVVTDLEGLKINGGKPLFEYVTLLQEDGTKTIRVGLTDETMKKGPGRIIEVGKGGTELDAYLKVVPDGSGRHDPLGVFVCSGQGIRKGQIVAAGAVHTILNDLLGHLRGLSHNPLLEFVFHILDKCGLINPLTTNDVAPTLLYLLDCPIPEYRVGWVMDRILTKKHKSNRIIKFVEKYDYEPDETSGDYSEDLEQKVIDRLRGLGYVD